ncbi:cation/multidrug efflux pump [Pleurocapsa sp. PCC 7327]|uniref:efflux RND transporter permease subunit n=1 Tax=Pleurocapsa sp. PCC 7327 TaxID=118163 RepID=UPI00029FE694|nr:efflux RND transporter permease subunit [Pleurocapsa sp. PCC 7327]AFY78151.1 cation/multidrug efflux pump [Pleurocapsa sp. PCC 7327]
MSDDSCGTPSDRAETQKPNLVGQITAYFINSQVTILLIAALIVFGIAAVIFTPKEENPQIVVPAADVYLQYPGAPAEVVEKTVTTPVEAKIREITGVEHIYSVSQNSGAKITVQFFVGENWEDSLFKLQNQLYNWQDIFPPGVNYLVKPTIIDDVPIVTLTIAGEGYSDNQLRRIGERLLEDLRSIPNTGNLTITGGQPRVMRVDLDPDKLASYKLSPAAIAQRLQGENIQLPAGDVSAGENRLFIEGGSLFSSAADLGDVIVGFSGGAANKSPIYLQDVATIKDDFGDRVTYSRIHYRKDWNIANPYPNSKEHPQDEFVSQNAVTIGIAKKKGTNAVTVAKQIFKRLDELKSQLPPGVEIGVSRNDGLTASRAVGDLYTSLLQAIAIVVALLVIFLGWREASIVAFVIPLTLAGTLLVGWIAGQTINRITLFALILALGTLVDDAISATENIHRRFALKANMSFSEKTSEAIAAVAELGVPIILSTVTVILAFLPMRFVTGMMGPYMAPIPFNVPVAMLISTTLALTVTPFLALRLIKIKPKRETGNGSESAANESEKVQQTRIYKLYRRILEPLLDSTQRRRFVLFFITGLLLASFILPLTQAIKFRMLPKANKDTFLVQLDAPLGKELVETDRIVREMEAALTQDPEVVQFESYVGTGAPIDFNGLLRGSSDRTGEHFADIRVHLTNKEARKEDSEAIVFRLRSQLSAIATANNAIVKLVEDPPGPPVRSTMLAEIYGADYDRLCQLAKTVRQVFSDTKEVVDIDDSVKNRIPQMKLVVDRNKINQAGLTAQEIAQTLNMAIAGANVSTLQVPGELSPVAIQVRFTETNRQNLDDLTRIQIPTPTGNLVPLTELVEFKPTIVDEPIFHKDQRPVTYVMGEMGNRSSVYAVIDQMIYFLRHPLPQGYNIKWDGEWKLTLDVFRDLGLAMLVAVMLIYFILVGQFRSFKVPLIIMGAIPLALIGILVGFSLNGVYFSATAMIGVIALAGIVVRNAIVLLEFIGDRLREGVDLKTAILEAGAVRFRPILLTSVTTMLGTLSILNDPVWSGLAWTLLCGMLTSSALTLIVIPLMYYGEKRSHTGSENISLSLSEQQIQSVNSSHPV